MQCVCNAFISPGRHAYSLDVMCACYSGLWNRSEDHCGVKIGEIITTVQYLPHCGSPASLVKSLQKAKVFFRNTYIFLTQLNSRSYNDRN